MKACSINTAVFALGLLLDSHAMAGDKICFEAEDMEIISEPMALVDAAKASDKAVKGASEDKYLEISQGKGNPPKVTTGEAAFIFDVQMEGRYYLWCRVWWDDECGNSFTMRIDDALPFSFGEDATYNCWHWVRALKGLKQLDLSKGKHKLTIHNREDGVRLDQILFVMDKNYVPVAVETATVTSSKTKAGQ